MKWTIDYLRENNLIIYEYMRGSHAYHLNVETSDLDIGGVFVCPEDMLYGLRSNYVEQVADEKNDTVFYEFGRWIELLLKNNPTALESLFIPDDCVIGTPHPVIQYIRDNKEAFISQECFKSFGGYAYTQIGKATGYNKKCHIPEDFQRKDILDFCYTFKNQGSQPIKDFLAEHNLDQRYCGLVNIPNMRDVYGVYYDFAAYWKFENLEGLDRWTSIKAFDDPVTNMDVINRRIENKQFFGYAGIVYPDDITKSNEVRLSSIPKGEKPICFMHYNKDAYTCHCRDYKEWAEWKAKRNPVRFESNLHKNYDAKNMMHCMRLIRMAKELAQGKGFNVARDEDRQYLLDIRNHKYEYDELMAQVEQEKAAMEKAIETTTIPKEIDYNKVNQLLIDARKQFYGSDKRKKKTIGRNLITQTKIIDNFDGENKIENGGN